MSEFSERYPLTAGKFDTSHEGFSSWVLACEDHGWHASEEIFPLADSLMMVAVSWYQPRSVFTSYKFSYRFARMQLELGKMARKTTQQKKVARAKWQGFIDYRLTEDQLMELDEWNPTPAEIWEQTDRLMEANYRVTLSYNTGTKTATATLIDDDPERKSGGWALASSDSNGALALKAALYKHFLVLQGSWENLLDLPNTGGRRG